MDKLNELQAYTAQWCGEDGDLLISGIDEKDMTQEELDSPKQTVTMYTKKQVMELLGKKYEIVILDKNGNEFHDTFETQDMADWALKMYKENHVTIVRYGNI